MNLDSRYVRYVPLFGLIRNAALAGASVAAADGWASVALFVFLVMAAAATEMRTEIRCRDAE